MTGQSTSYKIKTKQITPLRIKIIYNNRHLIKVNHLDYTVANKSYKM